MYTRRQFFHLGGAAAGGLLLYSRFGSFARAFAAPIPGGSLDPATIPKYAQPLTVAPAMPRTGRRPGNGRGFIDYYEIAARRFRQQVLPPPLSMTTVFGYGSIHHPNSFSYPAHTIEAAWDTPVRVKWINGLVDARGRYLPHLLPVDPTLHWANPGGGERGRDERASFADGTPGPYRGPIPLVTHLHGGITADDSDGYPTAWTLPEAADIPDGYARVGTQWQAFRDKFEKRVGVEWSGGSSTYQYENTQRAAGLWYHDHALGLTRVNIYAGLSGHYLLRGGPGDAVLDAASGGPAVLPGPAPRRGDPPDRRHHEIALTIQDRSFNADGSLFFPDSRSFFDGYEGPYIGNTTSPSDIPPIWNPEFFGNVMVVNGRSWPYLEVEPRRYRFRLLNVCNARVLILRLSNGAPIWQIGADGGFLREPVALERIVLAPAERADVIVDFAGLAPGSRLVLENVGPDEPFGGGEFAPADPDSTGQVMQFRVVALAERDPSTPPERLLLPAPPAQDDDELRRRRVSLNELSSSLIRDPNDPAAMFGPLAAMLGTVGRDPATRAPAGEPMAWADAITEKPRRGRTELWEIYNFTEDAHPIHIHQTQFQILEREVFDPLVGTPGDKRPAEAWESGRKDTVIAYPGEITRLAARFELAGLYVWHCHITDHEDNEMMRPLLIR